MFSGQIVKSEQGECFPLPPPFPLPPSPAFPHNLTTAYVHIKQYIEEQSYVSLKSYLMFMQSGLSHTFECILANAQQKREFQAVGALHHNGVDLDP